jgi:lipopolysaccharide/colanic/teichoic acid biosynthesis glycosyltransferase
MFAFIYENADNKLRFKKDISSVERELQCNYFKKINEIGFEEKLLYEAIKRGLDIFFCLLIAPVAVLLIFIFGIAIIIESPGSIFFKQLRTGLNGESFTIFKLRSFINSYDPLNIKWTIKNDPNVTSIGRFIRRTRIDELPQIWNILKGEMSFIGPRPEQPELTLKFMEKFPNFILRNSVKPGLTGWAQINGGYELTPREKLVYDLYYIKTRNYGFDLYIILKTFLTVINGKGAF